MSTNNGNSSGIESFGITYNEYEIKHYYYPRNNISSMNVRCVMDMSASDWFAANRNRLYLKNTSSGFVWSQLSEVAESGSYDDLKNKPTIPPAQIQSDWNQSNSTELDYIKNKPTLATVATSGSYSDLGDKPTIPAAQVNSDWDASSGVAQILNKPSLATVATSGNYNDLGNKPSIPTLRTMNGEQLTDSTLGDINIHDGFYFPNAVQDYDGNWYGAVVIGEQVWLGENLRTTHYADGTAITQSTASSTSAAYYWPASVSKPRLGNLYNRYATVRGYVSSDTTPSGIQGVSPNGWHIPSANEFGDLVNYLSNQKRYIYNNIQDAVAKSIASTSDWTYAAGSTSSAAPGKNRQDNNKTGFNAYPTGYLLANNKRDSNTTRFWTSKQTGIYGLCYCVDGEIASILVKDNIDAASMNVVRCVSDLTPIQFRDWYINQYGTLQHYIPSDDEINVQSDWNEADNTKDSFIKNKPTLGTAAALDVAASGNASSTQVVKGDDTRLESDTFVCNYNLSNNTMDKTPEEIYNAYIAGKTVLCKSGPTIMYLTQTDIYNTDSYYLRFQQIINPQLTPVQLSYLTYFNDVWSLSARNLQPQLIGSGTGQNIKTINNNNILGSGDLHISGDIMFLTATATDSSYTKYKLTKSPSEIISLYGEGITVVVNVNGKEFYRGTSDNPDFFNIQGGNNVKRLFYNFTEEDGVNTVWRISSVNIQEQLSSGTNIKTINNESILGSGDITITASGISAIPSSEKGANNGVAELDENGKVPSSQLPAFVDDVVEAYYDAVTDRFYEESTFTTVITPASGKSWVDIPANKSYRWTGSVYVRVDEGVQLGETSSTAYRGDKGKANEDDIAAIKDGVAIDSFADVEAALPTAAQLLPAVTSTDNGKILIIDNGVWAATAVPVADNVLF